LPRSTEKADDIGVVRCVVIADTLTHREKGRDRERQRRRER
jgi:hypothetical protein